MSTEHLVDQAALAQWRRALHQAQRFAEAEQFLDATRRAERTREELEVAAQALPADHPLREEALLLLARARRVERALREGYVRWRERLQAMHERRLDPEYQAEVVRRPLPEGLPG